MSWGWRGRGRDGRGSCEEAWYSALFVPGVGPRSMQRGLARSI